jgi:hypothetical protein
VRAADVKFGMGMFTLLMINMVYQPSLPAAIALFVAGAIHCYELFQFGEYEKTNENLFEETLNTMVKTIDRLDAEHAAVIKMAEDTKKLLSQANLAAGFTQRGQRN